MLGYSRICHDSSNVFMSRGTEIIATPLSLQYQHGITAYYVMKKPGLQRLHFCTEMHLKN